MERKNLTQTQKEILIGILLGDGCLYKNKLGINYTLEYGQSLAHSKYFHHIYEIFSNHIQMKPYKKKNGWRFRTRVHSDFTYFANLFYQPEKKIPQDIEKLLTPRSLAYWYMDDGSMKSVQSKGLIFNTHCFSFDDVTLLCSILNNKFGLKTWPRLQRHKNKTTKRVKTYYQIYISGYSYEKARNLMYPFFLPDMLYKFPKQRKSNSRFNKIA